MRTILFLAFLALWCGCSPKREPRSDIQFAVPTNLTAEQTAVIDVAKRFVSTNRPWRSVEFESPTRDQRGQWSVYAMARPVAPGLNLTIKIDDTGHVTDSYDLP